MNTFPGWRGVGQAMRWARTRNTKRTTKTTTSRTSGLRSYHSWESDNDTIIVNVVVHADGRTFLTANTDTVSFDIGGATAPQALAILAAVDLIPARFSSVYHLGRGDGMVDFAEELTAIRQTYDIVEATGRAVKP